MMATNPPSQTQYLTLGDGNMSFSYNLSIKLRTAALQHRALEYQALAKLKLEQDKTIDNNNVQAQPTTLDPQSTIAVTTPRPLPPLPPQPLGFFLTATSFDTRSELNKYPGVSSCIATIQKTRGSNGLYLGGVNATAIEATIGRSLIGTDSSGQDGRKWGSSTIMAIPDYEEPSPPAAAVAATKKYDLVYFNNPHVGTEDLFKHISLLSHFFVSVDGVLEPRGQVVVTLCDDQPNRWQLLQCAYHCGFICIAAIELNTTEWPYFQHKRHQNDTAFPFNRMIQYYFVKRADLLFPSQTETGSSPACENAMDRFDIKCPRLDEGDFLTLYDVLLNEFNLITHNTPTESNLVIPPHLYRCDLSIWSHIAQLSLSLSCTKLDNPAHGTETSAIAPPALEQKATNVGNWVSNDENYIPLLPILQPHYAFYPLTEVQQQQQKQKQQPQQVQTTADPPIFNPKLSLNHLIAAYRLQFAHLRDPANYNSYLAQWLTAVTALSTSLQTISAASTADGLMAVENKQDPDDDNQDRAPHPPHHIDHVPKKQRVKSPDVAAQINHDGLQMEVSLGGDSGESNENGSVAGNQIPAPNDQLGPKYRTLLSKLPPNTELPPSLDQKHLGRALTQRELIKLERFVQRAVPKIGNPSVAPHQAHNDNDVGQENANLTCVLCHPSRHFKSRPDLDKHLKIKHNDNFSTSLLLPNQPSQPNTIRIPVYPTGRNDVDLDYAGRRDGGIVQGGFCSICSILFESEVEYRKHLEFLSPQQGGFKCQLCPRVFNNERALAQHETLKHG